MDKNSKPINKSTRKPANKPVSKPASKPANKPEAGPSDKRPKSVSPCPYFRKCGGCDYIGLPYAEQLAKKQKYVQSLLGDIAKENKCRIEPIVGADEPLYYRNKVHSVFDRDSKGKIIRGMYKEDTHDVVNVSGCLLEDKTADAIIEEIKRLLPSFKLKVYDEDTGYGWLRHVLVRVASEGYMVVLVTAEVPFPGKNNFIKALRTRFPEIVTIVQNINNKRTSMVLGERNIVIYGKGFVEDGTLGLKFRISPGSFYQINSAQTKKLYGLALEMASLTGNERVLDAYCGTGTIGMFMSTMAREVIGVELNKDAVKDAVNNARGNKISNITFVNADATKYMQMLAGSPDSRQIDVLCMDPPRSGSTNEFINAAAALEIPRIVYVSCNPETLARDLKVFTKKGYAVKRIVPVDMFPATGHVETCVLITK